MKSYLKNCFFITDWNGADNDGIPIFDFKKDGRAWVRMDGYVIAPKHLFTERELSRVAKRARIKTTVRH